MEGVDQVPEGGVDAPAGGEIEGEQTPAIEGLESGDPSTGGATTVDLER